MRLLLLLPLLLLLAACTDDDGAPQLNDSDGITDAPLDPAPTVLNAYAAATPAGGTGGAFMTIQGGGEDDVLLSASYPKAQRVEIHRTSASEDGMMQMERLDQLAISAGRQVQLEPGGLHVMLIGLTDPLTAGETLELTLTFEEAGTVVVPVEVRDLSALPSMGGGESMPSE
jgi:copper(I)-binding protein